MGGARIELQRGDSRRYRSRLERPDGVVVARDGEEIMRAKILTRAVCDLCAAGASADPAAVRRAVGERWWTGAVTPAALGRACDRLREGAAQWARLDPGEAIGAVWRLPPPG